MKICICSDGYPSQGLPYSSFIQVLAREMTRQGCEIFVVAPQSLTNHFLRGGRLAPKYFEDYIDESDGCTPIRVYRPYTLSFGEGILGKWTPRFNRFATERVIKKRQIKPDIFYAHFWACGFNAGRIAQKSNTPLFVATGEDKISITSFLNKGDISDLNQIVSGVICVSTKNKIESMKLGLTADEKCVVIPNAYDPNEFYQTDKSEARKECGFSTEDFIVAFCGRFNRRKGAMRVAAAIDVLSNPNIKSIFIGSVADNETEKPKCDGILFIGELPHKDIVRYLNCADVFVLPSLAEGCPNSVIEAMACGLPIISSDLDFNYDILSSSTSILIDPEDIYQIAEAINVVYNDRVYCKYLSDCSLSAASKLKINIRVANILNFINSSNEKK